MLRPNTGARTQSGIATALAQRFRIAAAQNPEYARSKPSRRERNFWMQRQGAKNHHQTTPTLAETQIREISGRKSPQKRPIWRRIGNAWFARTGAPGLEPGTR